MNVLTLNPEQAKHELELRRQEYINAIDEAMEDEDEGEDIFAEDIYEFICKAESGWQERWKIIYLLLVGPQVQPWREFKELVEHIQRLEFPR